MNQHQLEVELLDRKRQQRIRVLSFIGSAVLVMVALWSAGVPPAAWFTRMQQWFASSPEKPAPVVQMPKPTASPPLPNAPPTSREVPPQALPGTDSSISPVPLALLLVGTSPGRNAHEGTAMI